MTYCIGLLLNGGIVFEGDAQFSQLTRAWSMGVRDLFTRLPEPSW